MTTDSMPGHTGIDISALFDVEDVAVVGASPGKYYSSNALRNLISAGMPADRIYPVNPGYESVDGLRCYPDLASLPTCPSLVVSLVRTSQVDAVLDQVVAAGGRAMMVIADGFSESGGEGVARQEALAAKAARHGVALLGPNSLGYAAPARGIGAWVAGTLPRLIPGNVALAFQSSGMLNVVMNQVAERRIGVSGAISVGNEAVADVADFVRHYAADESTSIIGMVLESTTRPRALATALLAARNAGKTLVVLSIGKSERGMLNAASHAGRLATGGAVWDALYRQVGAVVVEDLSDFLETIALAGGLPPGVNVGGLALATISGGDCGMLSDMAESLDVSLAEVDPTTQAVLDSALSRTGILPNPLDIRNTLTSATDVFWECITALASDKNVGVVGLRMILPREPGPRHVQVYTELAERVRSAGAACVFMSRVQEVSSPAWYELFESLNTPFLSSYGGALRAFSHLQRHERESAGVDPGADFSAMPDAPRVADSEPMDWNETMSWVQKWEIPYTASALAGTAAEAVQRASELGYPVAMKGVLPGLAHKTEHKLVELGLADDAAASAAAGALIERMSHVADESPAPPAIEVQAMVGGGTEFFLGAHRDPILGPVISFGLGGIFLEILEDVAHAIPPVTSAQAEHLLRRLKAWDVLVGARGRQPLDTNALTSLISKFSRAVATDAATVSAVDLNPVMVFEADGGVIAVDAYCERLS